MGSCFALGQPRIYKDDFILPASLEKTAPRRHREQLLDVMNHPQLSVLFREFLRNIFCLEGYEFYREVEEFRVIEDPEERKKKAVQIFKKFFSEDSEFEINVEGVLIEMLKESLQRPEKETFDLVQQLVLVTLEGTCLPQFLNWKLFSDFVNDPLTRKVFMYEFKEYKPLPSVVKTEKQSQR